MLTLISRHQISPPTTLIRIGKIPKWRLGKRCEPTRFHAGIFQQVASPTVTSLKQVVAAVGNKKCVVFPVTRVRDRQDVHCTSRTQAERLTMESTAHWQRSIISGPPWSVYQHKNFGHPSRLTGNNPMSANNR